MACVASGKCAMGSKSVLSSSIIEEHDYAVFFWDEKVLLDAHRI